MDKGINCEIGCALEESKEYLGPDITERDCVLVENVIDSAKSIIEVADLLKAKGARRIIVSAVHGLFTGDAG
jgi:phosphoribosylpyrophosphate synthetase